MRIVIQQRNGQNRRFHAREAAFNFFNDEWYFAFTAEENGKQEACPLSSISRLSIDENRFRFTAQSPVSDDLPPEDFEP